MENFLSDELLRSIQKVEASLKALKEGKGILLVDNEDRENEGDLIYSAEKMTKEQMALMIRECSGIVCLCLTQAKAQELNLSLMVKNNRSRYGTNFTVSIEAAQGVTTGVSAADRITTIRAAIKPCASPAEIVSPGHIFPLIAKENGVFERDGHTEGSVDLMKLAGLMPCAVLCELTNVDGSMARLPEIKDFAKTHNYPVVSISDIMAYRKKFMV